jgi:hypothetical protein
MCFFVWECLWVCLHVLPSPNSFSHNFPQIDYDCFKSTNLPTRLCMYPICSDKTDLSLVIYLLYYNRIPSGLLFVPNLESQMSNLHNMFIPCAICEWILCIYFPYNRQVSPHHNLIIEDALNWCHLLVGCWYSLFVLPFGVTAFPCIKFEGFHQIYPHLNSVMEAYEN